MTKGCIWCSRVQAERRAYKLVFGIKVVVVFDDCGQKLTPVQERHFGWLEGVVPYVSITVGNLA